MPNPLLLCLPCFPGPQLTLIPLLMQVNLSVAYSLIVPFPESTVMQGRSTYWNAIPEKFPLSEIFNFTSCSKHWLASVQFSHAVVSDFADPMDCSTPGLPVHHQLLELTKIHVHQESVMPSNHLILCHPLLLPPSILQSIRVFSSEWVLRMRWPKYWSFSFSISPSNEYSELISFRIHWLDLPAVQGTLKSLLQHHSSKASILRRSAFFTVQLSHPYMTTRKTIALKRWTFVGKVMSLLFNMLPRLVIAFLPRSKHLFISWLSLLNVEI